MVVIQAKRIQRMQLFTLQVLFSDGDKYYLIFRPGSIYLKKTTDEVVYLKSNNYAHANMMIISGCIITAFPGILTKFTVC
jgi:hypothetical protein